MENEELFEFFQQFQDHLAPKLDVYEQAIYLYIFRHSRLIGINEVVIGFSSARHKIARGTGLADAVMSVNSVYKRLSSLDDKGCIELLQIEHKGRRLKLFLPNEMVGLVPPAKQPATFDIEKIDFFNPPENRIRILEREDFRCFYTLKSIDANSFVAEHVVSRPEGDNSYRNIVAASREANNMKGAQSAETFLRKLYRDGLLSDEEFKGRLSALKLLKSGHLKPTFI